MMKQKKRVDAVLFDMDNVLIDTRRSYLDAIRWTVELYLTAGKVPFFYKPKSSGPPELLTAKDVQQFKMLGGFNDDWDCCYGLLTYLFHLPVTARTLKGLKSVTNIPGFASKIKTRPLGVSGIVKLLGRSPEVKIESIGRIFQEVYLGKGLYESVEHKKLIFWKKQGLIRKEKFVFKKSILENLCNAGIKLGIATGRPRFEAFYALKHFGVIDFFDAMTTMDDVRKAEAEKMQSLRKPHPFSLIQTARKIGASKKFLYVGDLPDDVLAAHAAKKEIKIEAVAFPSLADDRHQALLELQKTKPDFILKRPSALLSLVFGK